MSNFWDGFEKRAIIPGLGYGAKLLAAHLVPNLGQLAALHNPAYAKHLGEHFSAGLFNLPTTPVKEFGAGLVAAVAPEHPLATAKVRELGNQLREHLLSAVGHVALKSGVPAIQHALMGNTAKAMAYNPEVTHAVLEFAKQNKINPLMAAANMKHIMKNENHPLLTNVLPNLVRLPTRYKPRGAPASVANLTKGPLAKGNLEKGEAAISAKDDAMLGQMAKGFTHPKTTAIKNLLKRREKESFIPDLEQFIAPETPRYKKTRMMGALTGTGASALYDTPWGAMNALKYMYFGGSPKFRAGADYALRKLRVPVGGGKRWGGTELMHGATTGRLESAFERGLVENRPLNPVTNMLHRLLASGVQGETARTMNAIGRAGAGAIPPEHRKNVYENIMGVIHKQPGALQAKAPATPLGQQLKPFVVPAAAGAAAGVAGYAAGRSQRKPHRPQVAPGGNVLPFVQPPQSEQQFQYGGVQ